METAIDLLFCGLPKPATDNEKRRDRVSLWLSKLRINYLIKFFHRNL